MDRLERVLELLDRRNLFLTGGAGVGKSFLTRQIIDHYRSAKSEIAVLGSTGISAVNVGGQTLHSFFVFGISKNFEELQRSDRYNKKRLNELHKILKKLKLIVIDEISMVSADTLDMILYRLRSGGFKGRILAVGDFFQLPPVQKAFSTNETIFGENLYAFESSAWEYFDFINVELTGVKRCEDEAFMEMLEFIRRGELNERVFHYLEGLREHKVAAEDATILFGTNREADRINFQKLSQKEGTESSFEAELEIKEGVDERRVNSWINALPVPQKLILKEGVPVLFTTNRWGFYHNGEKGIVEHIDDDMVVVEKGGRFIKVERYAYDLTQSVVDHKGEVDDVKIASFSQFPLRVAYAITIHKSQGMSIDNLICNVDSIFADSQFYVALSRATDPKTLALEYTKGDFRGYLQRAVRVSSKVIAFYESMGDRVVLE